MDNQQPSLDFNLMNKKPKSQCGFIYMYTSPNGKHYIGQTIQTLMQRSKKDGSGYKHCDVFYHAIKKYSFENFKVEILEETLSNLLDEKEKEWIQYYDCVIPNGYNIATGGDGHSKQVHQYDGETGKYIATYSSLTEAAKINHIASIQPISDVLHGKTKCSYGYIWSFNLQDSVEPQKQYSNKATPVCLYNLDGTFAQEFDSKNKACKFLGISMMDMNNLLNGRLHQSHGYQIRDYKADKIEAWVFGPNGKIPVAQIDPLTNKIIHIFSSQSEAAHELGLTGPSGIQKCVKGKQKTCAGFRWEIFKGSTTTDSQNPRELVQNIVNNNEDIV